MKRAKVLDRVGVFSLDPGTTSGLTWGIYEPGGTVAEVVKRGLIMTAEVKADEGDFILDQEHKAAKIIAHRFIDLRFRWMLAGIPYAHQFFVYEGFILVERNGRGHSSVRTGISPARVTALVQGMLTNIYEEINWVEQQPGEAKNYATDYRLKEWGLWIRGEQHSRDALRHTALWVAKNF